MIIVAILFAITITYAQNVKIDSNAINLTTLPDSSLVTFSKVYKDVTESLSGLAEGLKVGATYVFEVLVKQQFVRSIVYCCLNGVLIILLLYFFISFVRNNKHLSDPKNEWFKHSFEDHFQIVGNFVISCILFALLFIIILVTFSDIITGFVNPDYGAIQEIINFTK